jgi:hypothetical protein
MWATMYYSVSVWCLEWYRCTISQLLELKTYIRACSVLLLQAIPDKFVQRFRGLIANSVNLESRCGHTFDVEVANNLGKLVLQTGWKAFVTAHDLNMGDFLVFKYDGTSRLKVLIFDLSCCEKVPPCLVKRPYAWQRKKGRAYWNFKQF